MKLTTCENNQLVEVTRLWFAKNGGPIELILKSTPVQHSHSDSNDVMPPGFSKHKILKTFYEKPLEGYYVSQ